ncbi:MAG: hypothetical protein K0R27_4173 [Xanthobacteraceae bacterium]|jgi:uncharacterized membrane protein YhaH (DUF805 family)|nr:hypothetical protein [Xanthobacteraceae bacterium]
MNFTQAVTSGFQQYAGFAGRAARSEFWFWVLFTVLVSIATNMLDVVLFGYEIALQIGPLNALTSLALLVPSIAIGTRRLHDIDRTGWWQLLMLTGIGLILLVVWWCFRGTAGPNRFGADPLG